MSEPYNRIVKNANGTQNLLTKTIIAKIPSIEEAKAKGMEAKAMVKFFHPSTGYYYFVAGYDRVEGYLWGYAYFPHMPENAETGEAHISEMANLTVRGVALEQDKYWKPRTLKEIAEHLKTSSYIS